MMGAKSPAVTAMPADRVDDPRARLSALMRAYGDAIHAYTVRMLRDRTLAADVLQQVFEQAYRDLDDLRDERHVRSWLFGIAHHRCLDAHKARQRAEKRLASEDASSLEIVSDQPEPWKQVEAKQIAAALERCVGELSVESRTAVLLRFHHGMTYEQMSAISGEKPATLQARVTRALPVLRRCLETKGVEL